MKTKHKKFVAIILSLLMCVYVILPSAFAADEETPTNPLEMTDEGKNTLENEDTATNTSENRDATEDPPDNKSDVENPSNTKNKPENFPDNEAHTENSLGNKNDSSLVPYQQQKQDENQDEETTPPNTADSEEDKVPNQYGLSTYRHVDVKVQSEMNVTINGVTTNIQGTLQQEGLKVTIGAYGGYGPYTFTQFAVSYNEPKGDVEYRQNLDFPQGSVQYLTKTDKPYINSHNQDYSHLFVGNVTIDATILFPLEKNEILEDLLPKTSDGKNYYLELKDHPYDFINECCGAKWERGSWTLGASGGRKSKNGIDYPAGLDLYITGKDIEHVILGKAEIRKVGTGLDDGVSYPNPTLTIKNNKGATVQDNISVITNGESVLIENLKPGSYTIDETIDEVAGYTCETSGTEFNIIADETTTVAVTNAYTKEGITPPPITVDIKAQKELVGKALEDDQFKFTLESVSGGTTTTVSNDAEGNIAFDLIFEQPGSFSYYLREINDTQENITYDDTVYKVVVAITQKGDVLVSAVQYFTEDNDPVDGVLFTNTYEKPSTPFAKSVGVPLSHFPQTGDNSFSLFCLIMLGVSLGGAGLILFLRKKLR